MAIANTPSLNISIRLACPLMTGARDYAAMLWAALLTIYVVWGSTYLAIRVMVETMPPLLAAGARFAVAGGVFLAGIAAARGPGRVKGGRRGLARAAPVGLLLPFGGHGPLPPAQPDVPP